METLLQQLANALLLNYYNMRLNTILNQLQLQNSGGETLLKTKRENTKVSTLRVKISVAQF